MAIMIYSTVTTEPEAAIEKICDMIEKMPEVHYEKKLETVIKTFYSEAEIKQSYNEGETRYPITNEGVATGWLLDYVGANWISVEVLNDDEIRIESAKYVPDRFLLKLYSLCTKEFENVILKNEWNVETENLCGTVVIWNGMYAEDSSSLDDENITDHGYWATGDEPIKEIKKWLLLEGIREEDTIDKIDEEECRNLFESSKQMERIDEMWKLQKEMYSRCIEAIQSEDLDYPISKLIKIGQENLKQGLTDIFKSLDKSLVRNDQNNSSAPAKKTKAKKTAEVRDSGVATAIVGKDDSDEIGKIGPAGGFIFYDKGKYTDGWRYLEAAPSNLPGCKLEWHNGKDIDIKTGTAIGSGKSNSDAIIALYGKGIYAAYLCRNLNLGGFSDWFLPSKNELYLMYTKLKNSGLGGFSDYEFWSSSQYGHAERKAWCQDFGSGKQEWTFKSFDLGIRACRAF